MWPPLLRFGRVAITPNITPNVTHKKKTRGMNRALVTTAIAVARLKIGVNVVPRLVQVRHVTAGHILSVKRIEHALNTALDLIL